MTLVIPGQPVPKARPRFGRGRAFTDKRTKDFEERVANCARLAKLTKYDGPVCLEVCFFLKARRGDIDNYVKSLMDGLNGIAWVDDSQVYVLSATKKIDAERPRCEVTILPLEQAQ